MGYGAKIYRYESFNVILDLAMAKSNGLDPLKVLKDNIIAYHDQEIKYYRQNMWKWYKHWKQDYHKSYERNIDFPVLRYKKTRIQDIIRNLLNKSK